MTPRNPFLSAWLRAQTAFAWNLILVMLMILIAGWMAPIVLQPFSCHGALVTPSVFSETFAYTLFEGALYLCGFIFLQLRTVVWISDVIWTLFDWQFGMAQSMAITCLFVWVIVTEVCCGSAISRVSYQFDPRGEYTGDVAPFSGAVSFWVLVLGCTVVRGGGGRGAMWCVWCMW